MTEHIHSIADTLTEKERYSGQQNAQELQKLLSIWASCYPVIRPKRVPPVAVLIVYVLPRLPMNHKLLVGKLILLIFAIDDIADERIFSYDDFLKASKEWEEIARHGKMLPPLQSNGDINLIISEIRHAMLTCPLFPAMKEDWAQQVRLLCQAMAREYRVGVQYKASGEQAIPDMEAYLQDGIYSVGFPFWGTSVLILLSDPDITDHMPTLKEILVQTGASIRLYNDVRTYEKEVQESNVNAVTILLHLLHHRLQMDSKQSMVQQAQELVLIKAKDYAERSIDLLSRVRTKSGQFEEMIRRIIAFHAYFYGSQVHNFDYHTISSGDANGMLQKHDGVPTPSAEANNHPLGDSNGSNKAKNR